MREPAPDYASRHYERPNQPWVCGLAADGAACPAGPTAGGGCPALAECVPAREGDRWKCNRSTLRGGECAEGPTPEGGCGCVHRCRPVRSLRAIRGRFVTACTLLAAGGLMILLSADWRDRAISPGPLARQHGQLLGNEPSPGPSLQGRGSCAACHAAAERSVGGWTASLVGYHGGGLNQSQRCMECHSATIPKEFALTAHNVPLDELRRITAKIKGSELFSKANETSNNHLSMENSSDPFIACATCHREHQGAQVDLTAMNDAACQSCHQQRYESFSTDHPDFGEWPYERRTRIVFNHASHQAKHFAEKKQKFDCQSCHVEDATQSAQLLASYASACASCHDEKIAMSVTKGAPMFALPTLDVDALTTAGHDVGDWPADATGDFDGKLPPAMKLLLAGDPAAAEAMTTLGADFEFFDIDPENAEQLEACATLVVAIKKLFAELGAADLNAVRGRIKTALGREVPDTQLDSLLAGLPSETIESATKSWLPDIGGTLSTPSGVSMSASGSSMPRPPGGKGAPPERTMARPIAFDPVGTWSRDDSTLSIRYQSKAHADPVLAGWLELLAATPEIAKRPIALAMFKELSSPTAPGLCSSCHSSERAANGQLTINWRAYDRTKEPRSLTRFSHRPHVLLPQLADCTSCHAINAAADTSTSYATDDPHTFASDFAPISKQQCAQCHTAKAAGENCQKCHNYHVDGIEDWRRTSISDFGLRIAD